MPSAGIVEVFVHRAAFALHSTVELEQALLAVIMIASVRQQAGCNCISQ